MFESLRKKLKIFKESVSTEESELNTPRSKPRKIRQHHLMRRQKRPRMKRRHKKSLTLRQLDMLLNMSNKFLSALNRATEGYPHKKNPFLNEKSKARTSKIHYGTLR